MSAWMGAVVSRLVPTGVRLGVFDKLADGPLTADEVADALELNRHGTTVLLEGLTGCRADTPPTCPTSTLTELLAVIAGNTC